MKNKFYTIREKMKNGSWMSIEQIALVTGLAEMDVLEIINNNKLLFNEMVVPLDGVRDNSCFYELNDNVIN